jgi:hypothetical protein
MSQRSLRSAGGLRLAIPMTARDPTEPDRAATPLELFFDLVFIVAVASAVDGLHHGWSEATWPGRPWGSSSRSSPCGGRG